jgi:hypothetical protein
LGQPLLVEDLDTAAALAFHETVGFQSAQRPVHHHAARTDHGCQVGALRNWMWRVEDRVAVPGRPTTDAKRRSS